MSRLANILVVAFLAALCPLGIAATAAEKAAPGPKRILILYDEDKDELPGLARADRALREALHAQLGKGADIQSESLGLSHFERPGYEAVVAEFFRHKYASSPPDVIVAVLEPPLDFLLRHSDTLFHDIPIVFSGVDVSRLDGKKLPANVTGVVVKRTFDGTLDAALRLQPGTRNVFVLGGASTFDRYLESLVRRDLQRFEKRVAITYLFGQTMDQWLARVSALPPDSVLLYTTVFADASGRTFVPHEVAASIAAAANAPMYVFLDQYLGLGPVGGNVYSLDAHQGIVAGMATKILRGASPASLSISAPAMQVDMFDARQLDRWKLKRSRLPSGSIVRYEDPSVWELYRWYIAAAIAILFTQGALIGGLLLARRRQRRAEADARQQRDDLAHVLRVTTLGELTTSLAHEINQPLSAILLNAQAAMRLLESGRGAQGKVVEEALTDIVASADHASDVIGRLRAMFRKESVEPVAVDVRTVIGDVVKLLHAAMLTERVDVRLAFEEPLPDVFGDPVQLEQVILNVVRNSCDAIGATRDGSRIITIRARQGRPGYMTVEVSDTGVGVSGNLEGIFEHFVSTKPKGLGMGLAISRSIISAHGGLIWATANQPRGLTIHIELVTVGEARRGEPSAANGAA